MMHIISRKPFRDAARQFPNARTAIEDCYRVLKNGTFNTPDKLRQVFPSLDNLKYRDRWWVIDISGNHLVLIELLSKSIDRWESSSSDFTQFNKRIDGGDQAVSLLCLLMEQHKLGVADLPEVGSKSLVSKILNERDRQLTRQHIDALSRRFKISPALFFSVPS